MALDSAGSQPEPARGPSYAARTAGAGPPVAAAAAATAAPHSVRACPRRPRPARITGIMMPVPCTVCQSHRHSDGEPLRDSHGSGGTQAGRLPVARPTVSCQ